MQRPLPAQNAIAGNIQDLNGLRSFAQTTGGGVLGVVWGGGGTYFWGGYDAAMAVGNGKK